MREVAAKLYQRIMPVINQDKVELIQMQFLERESFKNTLMPYWKNTRSKQLQERLTLIIKISHFFSAYDVFDDEKLNVLKRIADDEIPTAKIVDSLSGIIK